MSKSTEWMKRKEGFNKYAGIVKSELDNSKIAEAKDLADLTDFLQSFTHELFTFFLNGFSDFLGEKSKPIKLIPSVEYPPEYVLQKILEQASFDLTVIQRIIEQRKNDQLRPDLESYDKLARLALSIAFPDPETKNTGLIEPVKPFVYFQRDTSVRIVPYANTLLLGVPFSALCQPIDLLTIPHEIGHHVYETGKFSKTEPLNLFFQKYFADQPDWIQNWLEEIFADLYGFFVAGPIVGFSLQEILLDNYPGSLGEDDGDHPAGIIRPLSFSALFLSDRFNGVSGAEETESALRKRWQKERQKRGFANTFKPLTENNVIDGAKGNDVLASVLRVMNEQIHIKTNGAFDFPARPNPENKSQPWTLFPSGESAKPTSGQIKLEDPFANFNVNQVISSRQAQLEKIANLLDPSKFELSRENKNQFWLTKQIEHWNNQADLPPLLPNIWKLIFTAFNWAEQGPDDTRPVHKRLSNP